MISLARIIAALRFRLRPDVTRVLTAAWWLVFAMALALFMLDALIFLRANTRSSSVLPAAGPTRLPRLDEEKIRAAVAEIQARGQKSLAPPAMPSGFVNPFH